MKAALLARWWDAVLGGVTLASFVDMILILGGKKVALVASWYKSASKLEAWYVICVIFLGDILGQSATFNMVTLVEEREIVSAQIQAQSRIQT